MTIIWYVNCFAKSKKGENTKMEKEFNPQEIFDTSKELYENTYDMLKDMTEYYKKKTGSGNFKYVILVFDSILQFSS